MNKFIGIGRLVRDPELAYSKQGKAYTTFTIAINRAFKQDETDFLNCVTFGKGAESLANYQRKGNQIAVEGSVQIDKHEDKYFTKIIANNVQFLDSKGQTSQPQEKAHTGQNLENEGQEINSGSMPTDDSELPFDL